MTALYMTLIIAIVTITTLTYPGLVSTDQPDVGYDFLGDYNNMYGLGSLDFSLPIDKRASSPYRINMCLCCSRKQLSFCCEGCMRKRALGTFVNALDSESVSNSDNMLSYRLSTLRTSACTCCAQTSNRYSKCCRWCLTMEQI